MGKTRKYFRVKIHRIPPWCPINKDWYFHQDVWAYSKDGAFKKIHRLYKDVAGKHIPSEATEVSKEEFLGDKTVIMPNNTYHSWGC